jgi:hygromycin-B 4-O-kinase
VTTDETVLIQAMRDRFGAVGDWESLPGGDVSQSYAFRSDGRGLILRIGSRREGFDKDAWAATRFEDTPVPAPEVLDIGELEPGVWYCVSERMGGGHLEQLDPERQRATASAVLDLVDAIAAAELPGPDGYGSFDPVTGNAPHPTWAAHLRSLLPEDWNGLDDPIDTALADDLTAILAETVAEPQRRLVHGDLNPGNFTVDRDRIAGVFDWEAAVIGDPMWDNARHLLWAPMSPTARVLAEAGLARLGPESALRLRALVIANGLWAVAIYHRQGWAVGVDLILNRLHGFRDAPPALDDLGYWVRLIKPGTRT